MRKIIYALAMIIILLLIYSGFYPPIITPKEYFHVSKESRLNIIENLRQDCSADNPIYLISTYSDVFNDKNTSDCWGYYMKKCQERKSQNKNLKIPIKCSIY